MHAPACQKFVVDSRAVTRSGHVYHSSCVTKWFDSTRYQARSCPHCRQNPLVSDAEFEQVDEDTREANAHEAELRGNAAGFDTAVSWAFDTNFSPMGMATAAIGWGVGPRVGPMQNNAEYTSPALVYPHVMV